MRTIFATMLTIACMQNALSAQELLVFEMGPYPAGGLAAGAEPSVLWSGATSWWPCEPTANVGVIGTGTPSVASVSPPFLFNFPGGTCAVPTAPAPGDNSGRGDLAVDNVRGLAYVSDGYQIAVFVLNNGGTPIGPFFLTSGPGSGLNGIYPSSICPGIGSGTAVMGLAADEITGLLWCNDNSLNLWALNVAALPGGGFTATLDSGPSTMAVGGQGLDWVGYLLPQLGTSASNVVLAVANNSTVTFMTGLGGLWGFNVAANLDPVLVAQGAVIKDVAVARQPNSGLAQASFGWGPATSMTPDIGGIYALVTAGNGGGEIVRPMIPLNPMPASCPPAPSLQTQAQTANFGMGIGLWSRPARLPGQFVTPSTVGSVGQCTLNAFISPPPVPSFAITLSGAAPFGTALLVISTAGASCGTPASPLPTFLAPCPFGGGQIWPTYLTAPTTAFQADASGNVVVPMPTSVLNAFFNVNSVREILYVQWAFTNPLGGTSVSDGQRVTLTGP